MTAPIDVRPQDLETVKSILRDALPSGSGVWAFGSRATWKTTDSSDLDLAVDAGRKLNLAKMTELSEAFENSNLPYTVDLVDWHAVAPTFKNLIEKDRVRISILDDNDALFPMARLDQKAKLLSGGTPSKANPSYWDGCIPWLTPKDMGRWNGSTEELVSESALGNGTRLAPINTIFVAVRGMSLHTEIRAIYSKAPLAFNQDIKAIVPYCDVDALFLYYALSAQKPFLLDSVEAAGHGTGRLPTDILNAIEIPDLPLGEQQRIAALLGALDDKIDLNRRMNETLEAMARALFKDWFVDFGPVRAKAEGRQPPGLAPEIAALFPSALDDDDKPAGWNTSNVYRFADVVYGAPFASNQFNTERRGLPLIRIRDLADHLPNVYTKEQHPKATVIEAGNIIVGMDGEFRLHIWRGPPALLNQRVCSFRPKSGVPASFLAEALHKPLAFFERGKVGTTVIHLGKSDIDTFKIIAPSDDILKAYGELTTPLIQQYISNSAEARSLSCLRDLLLPKIMSGEIRLQDAEKAVETVL